MSMKQLSGILFLGDLYAEDWEDEDTFLGDIETEDALDAYLRYTIDGTPVRAELGEVTVLGSSRFADYQIIGKDISEKQIVCRREKGQYFVKNIGTRGSVYVGETELKTGEEMPLQPDDMIFLPGVSIQFRRRPAPAPGTSYSF